MYKKVYLILAHKCPAQINLLISALNDGESIFFIHLDKKIKVEFFELNIKQIVNYVQKRVKCEWGRFSLVQAIINSFSEILNFMDINFKSYRYHVILLSGEDYPVKNNMYISSFLFSNRGVSFINFWQLPYSNWFEGGLFRFTNIYIFNMYKYPILHKYLNIFIKKLRINNLLPINLIKNNFPSIKLYGQSQWGIFSEELISDILKIHRFSSLKYVFKYTFAPDELYIITLIMNYSAYKEVVLNYKTHFVKFKNLKPNPEYLKREDFKIIDSDSLFARKFDFEESNNLVETIEILRT